MVERFRRGVPASEQAKQEGVTTDAIVARIKRGQAKGKNLGYLHDGLWFWTGPEPEVLDLPTPLPADLPVLPAAYVALLAPYQEQIADLTGTVERLSRENGELVGEVKRLRADVRAQDRTIRRLVALVPEAV